MQATQVESVVRSLGFVVLLTVGVMLGAAVPALAESEVATTSAVCSTDEIAPSAGSEWAVPPSQERRGEPH